MAANLSVVDVNVACLKAVCDEMQISTKFIKASDLSVDDSLRGQERVLAICGQLGASEYLNLAGGKALYDRDVFQDQGLELRFYEATGKGVRNDRDATKLSIAHGLFSFGAHFMRQLLPEYNFK